MRRISSLASFSPAWFSSARQELVVRIAAYILLVALSFSIAVVGIFTIPSGPRVLGVTTSISWPIALVGNTLMIEVSKRLDSWAYASLVSATIWFVTVAVFVEFGGLGHVSQPENYVVPGTARGWLYLLIGVLATSFALGKALPRRRPRSGRGMSGAR